MFMCLLAISMSSLEKCLFKSFAYFKIVIFRYWVVRVFYITSYSDIWFANIFSHWVDCFMVHILHNSLSCFRTEGKFLISVTLSWLETEDFLLSWNCHSTKTALSWSPVTWTLSNPTVNLSLHLAWPKAIFESAGHPFLLKHILFIASNILPSLGFPTHLVTPISVAFSIALLASSHLFNFLTLKVPRLSVLGIFHCILSPLRISFSCVSLNNTWILKLTNLLLQSGPSELYVPVTSYKFSTSI